MPTGNPAPELDPEVLAAEVVEFLDQFIDHMEVAEGAGAKLNRLLLGLLKAEVLPQRRGQPNSALTQRRSCRRRGSAANVR